MKNLIKSLALVGVLTVVGSAHSKPLTLLVHTNQSSLAVEICLNPSNLGLKCDQQTNYLTGAVVVQLDPNGQPTAVSLQDFNLLAPDPYAINLSWNAGFATVTGTATNVGMIHNDPGPQNPFFPVSNHTFTLTNVPFRNVGGAAYTAYNFLSGTSTGFILLTNTGYITNMAGIVYVTNGVAWARLEFTTTSPITGTNLVGSTTTHGIVVASYPVPNLALSYGGGTVTITWDGGFPLQQATNVLGTYYSNLVATTPYTTSVSGPRKFYRVDCGVWPPP